jgi:hypothetical protein
LRMEAVKSIIPETSGFIEMLSSSCVSPKLYGIRFDLSDRKGVYKSVISAARGGKAQGGTEKREGKGSRGSAEKRSKLRKTCGRKSYRPATTH